MSKPLTAKELARRLGAISCRGCAHHWSLHTVVAGCDVGSCICQAFVPLNQDVTVWL